MTDASNTVNTKTAKMKLMGGGGSNIPETSYALTNLFNIFPDVSPPITQEMLYTMTAGTSNVSALITISEDILGFVYTRTVTTIPQADGTYATNTIIDPSSGEYEVCVTGNNYYGFIEIYGRRYEAFWGMIDDTHIGFVGVLL